MKKFIFGIFLVFALVLFGCSTQTSCPECPELDCSSCPVKTETMTEKIYVCQDLSEVENKEDCLKVDSEGWYEVITFRGDVSKITKLFTINSNSWRYTWSCQPTLIGGIDMSGISLSFYSEGTDPEDLFSIPKSSSLLNKCVDEETSYVYAGKGTYSLKVMGANLEDWEVKIEAKK